MHKFEIHPLISSISKILKDNNSLSRGLEILNEHFSERLTFGCEIEFYVSQDAINSANLDDFFKYFHYLQLTRERGNGQFEFRVGPIDDPALLIQNTTNEIEKIKYFFARGSSSVFFEPRPHKNDYGNALQIQFTSKCQKFQNNIEKICSTFCDFARSTFLAYAQTQADYERFDSNFMAPTHISFGYNNRTCLFRICGDKYKRIEIRSPSPICDLYVVFFTIIRTLISYINQSTRGFYRSIYGNAFDLQYNLPKIPFTIEEAEKYFDPNLYENT
ncbi:MAG: hypothetical protein SFT93_03795 [Rickettsiaceae bacterium]|nr:hypothetical protein [Rickettsiaceae bacterium]